MERLKPAAIKGVLLLSISASTKGWLLCTTLWYHPPAFTMKNCQALVGDKPPWQRELTKCCHPVGFVTTPPAPTGWASANSKMALIPEPSDKMLPGKAHPIIFFSICMSVSTFQVGFFQPVVWTIEYPRTSQTKNWEKQFHDIPLPGQAWMRHRAGPTAPQLQTDTSFKPQQRRSKDFPLPPTSSTKGKWMWQHQYLTALLNNHLLTDCCCVRENTCNSQENTHCWKYSSSSSAESVPPGSAWLPSKREVNVVLNQQQV